MKEMFMDLPPFTEEPYSEKIDQMFSEARINLVLGSSIYAYVMIRCEFIFTPDIPTAGACVHDDRNIVFINPTFFEKSCVNRKQRAFLLRHELDHIFFMHQERCIQNHYDHQIFNEATDFYINLETSGVYLDNDGHRRVAKRYVDYFEMPACGGLYDEKYLGMGADAIYEDLIKNPNPQQKKSSGGGTGQGQGTGAMGEGMFDIFFGNGGSTHQKQRNVQSAHAAVAFAEQSNSIGDNEGNLVRRIRDLAKPTVVWTDRLTALIQSSIKYRPTYNRLSRRSNTSGDGVVFPSYTGNKISVVFGFDSSGSMGRDDYAKVAGEVKGILEQFDSWKLNLVCCDMKVTELGVYSSEDLDDFETLNLEANGLGGTEMGGIARHAQDVIDLGEDIDACIVITDGYIDVAELDRSFPVDTKNIVLTTRNHGLEFLNADCIAVK